MANDRSRFFSSSNPFVSESRFDNARAQSGMQKSLGQPASPFTQATDGMMTVGGTMTKTLILALIMLIPAVYAWMNPSMTMLWGGMIGGLVFGFAAMFKPQYAHILGPLYSVAQGFFLGTLSLLVASVVGDETSPLTGIVGQALGLTMVVVFVMGILYKTGVIKATERFRSILTTATMAIMVMYGISLLGSFTGMFTMPYLHEGGIMGIGLSLLIVGIASLNLILDFDNIEQGAQGGAPKYMEWAAALGLMFTIVWIYVEILRLLMKLQSRN